MIFKNFADQDWIRFNFIGSGLGSDCNFFENWRSGLRKFLLYLCDYAEHIKNFGCDPISQIC